MSETCKYCKNPGHFLDNCSKLQDRIDRGLAQPLQKRKLGRTRSSDPRNGPLNTNMDPKIFNPKQKYTEADIAYLFDTVTSSTINSEEKIEIMEQAVAPCPEINVKIKSANTRGLLDSSSMVTLVTQSYFKEFLKPQIPDPSKGGINAHNLFNLKGTGDNKVPLSNYFSCDINIGGITVEQVGFLVREDCQLTDSKGQKSKLPLIIGCNLFKIATEKFIRDYGEEAILLFECPKELDPLFFSCLCLYYFGVKEKEGDQANGKKGVGAAHVVSSQTRVDSDAIGSETKDKQDSERKTNFPSKKKTDFTTIT